MEQNGGQSFVMASSIEPSMEEKFSAPYKYNENTTERISINTGDLTLESVDLHVPGRNGLDVNIITRYESANSGIYRTYFTRNPNRNHVSDDTYYDKRFSMGAGWSLGFSSVETDEYNNPIALHLGDGSVYTIVSKGSSYIIKDYELMIWTSCQKVVL